MNLEGRKKDEWNGMCHDPNETHFAVNKETGLIVNGWDYSDVDGETLRQFKKDYFMDDLADWGFNPKEYKILGRNACLKNGIDPDDITCWSNNGVEHCGQKTQSEMTPINEVKFDYDQNPLGLKSKDPRRDVCTFDQLAREKKWNIKPGQRVEQKIIDALMKYAHPKVYRRGVFQAGKPVYTKGMTEYYMTFDNDKSGWWVFRGWCPLEYHGPMRRMEESTEEELKYGQRPDVAYAGHTGKHGTFDNGYNGYFISDPNGGTLYPRNKKEAIAMIKALYPDQEDAEYVMSQLTKQGMNESMDQWEDAVYDYETREKLPKGWDKHERENDEPIYTDPDYQEYVKDEYGKFVPYVNEEANPPADDKNFVFHARTGAFSVNVAEEIEYDEYTVCLNCYINKTVPATIYAEKSAYDEMKNGGQYCDCVCKIARSIKDDGEEIEGTLSRMNMNESIGFNEQTDMNENNNEMWDAIIEYGMGDAIEEMVYDFCEKHDMENIDNLVADEVKHAVFQVVQNHIRTMQFLNRGWEFR